MKAQIKTKLLGGAMTNNTLIDSKEILLAPPGITELEEFDDLDDFDAIERVRYPMPDLEIYAKPRPFMALKVERAVNIRATEFMRLRQFHYALAEANNALELDDEGGLSPRHELDDYKTSLTIPEQLNINLIYAKDVGQIILRNFCGEGSTDVNRPRNVLEMLRRASKKINAQARRKNREIQDELLYSKHQISNGPRRGLGLEDENDEMLPMTNGIFRVGRDIGVFGFGNIFGLTLSENAGRFLRYERERALDITLSELRIKHLDKDIENSILSSEMHVSLLRLGSKVPQIERTIVLPRPVNGKILPETFVTGFDPKAKVVPPHAKQRTP